MSNVNQLDQEAWDRWVAYRRAIKKPIKPASEHAMKIKLTSYGENQAEVVDQSISNQWQGLFDLKKALQPGEKPKKSREQVAADSARWEWQVSQAEKSAHSIAADPIGELRMLDAVLARLMFQQEDLSFTERYERLKSVVAERIAAADPAKVLGDPHLRSMVLQLWNDRGVNKLIARAKNA